MRELYARGRLMLRTGINLQVESVPEAIQVPHFLADVDRKCLIYMRVSPRSWLRSSGGKPVDMFLEVPSRHDNNRGFLDRNQWAALLTWLHHQAVRAATNISRPWVEPVWRNVGLTCVCDG
jgi:hypothetical protein